MGITIIIIIIIIIINKFNSSLSTRALYAH